MLELPYFMEKNHKIVWVGRDL